MQQPRRDRSKAAAAGGRAYEELFAGWNGRCQAVGTSMFARPAFVGHERLDVRWVFDLRPAVVAARVIGKGYRAVEDAHALWGPFKSAKSTNVRAAKKLSRM